MSKSYRMGDVGPGARVQQGEHLTMIENALAPLPDAEILTKRFEALVGRLSQEFGQDDDSRELAVTKTRVVAELLGQAANEPGKLRRALIDAKHYFLSTAGWAWEELASIIKSDAAQKTIGTIAEATARAAIMHVAGP